ncbi:hypothetical protein LCI18_003307 [Fusarium solani-melongenae]|uniref:Uncharacterized protein n=1 Tax=Fusarium solani subsp. cucurbitae TaxID=2747967 RepID=A0ACD3YTR0_FUSSC|nr:hypothetical protein LCI18_003307 [Fusarium solani-melongenae]
MSARNNSSSADASKPNLPTNVCIFSPKKPSAVNALLSARVFTRLVASASTKPAQLAAAIKSYQGADESFCLVHRDSVLIFDGAEGDKQGDELDDVHHEHFRVVCLALKEHDIGLDVAGCIHDANNALGAGFQLDRLNDGAALVIDLVEDEEDSDDED